jgi:hypothetical protein
VVALAGGGIESFQGGFAFGFGHRGKEREQHPARPGRIVDAGQRAGEHLQYQAVRGQVVGQCGEVGGVAAQPFHLIHRQDDAAVRGVRLDLPGQGKRGLELRTDFDPGRDLLPRYPVRGPRVQLRLQFLGEGGAAGVADPNVGGGSIVTERRGRRCAGPPRLARVAVGRT